MANSNTTHTDKQVTYNPAQRLYVIPTGGGYSCLGLDVLVKRYALYAAWAERYVPGYVRGNISCDGRLEDYAEYSRTLELMGDFCRANRVKCEIELCAKLKPYEGRRVEVTYKFSDTTRETRRFWVGKSTGWMPIHLEIARRDSTGGSGVLADCVESVKLIESAGRR